MGDEGQLERRLTVVRVHAADGYAEVMFYESARIYRLLHTNPAYEAGCASCARPRPPGRRCTCVLLGRTAT